MKDLRGKSAVLALALVITVLTAGWPAMAVGADETVYPGPEIYFQGERMEFTDQQPIIYQDRTMVPVRGVLETMGATVDWYASIRYVEIAYKDCFINVYIGNPLIRMTIPDEDSVTGYINKEYLTDVAPQIIGDRTMVPLRILSELMGMQVDWLDGKVYLEEKPPVEVEVDEDATDATPADEQPADGAEELPPEADDDADTPAPIITVPVL